MIFELKKTLPGLIFIFSLFFAVSWAAEADIPLPKDAVKISAEESGIGPFKLLNRIYETSLDKNRITAFFKNALVSQGWQEKGELNFVKGEDSLMVMISPGKNADRKTIFFVSSGKIPSKEELFATRKKNPDKLNFMPIYPSSEQVHLWDLSDGMTAQYETVSSVKDVVFFYKSGMLNYNWNLKSETPIEKAAIGCPECEKKFGGGLDLKSNNMGVSTQADLVFARGKETCKITVVNVSVETNLQQAKTKAGSEESPINKTTISVVYNANKESL